MRIQSALLSSILLASALRLEAQAKPSKSPLERVQVTVAATNDEWTPTTITIHPGDILLVNAAGKVKVGQYLGEVDADGSKPNGEGALELKIGVGAGSRVGARGFLLPTQEGVVKLRVHDTKFEDNSGQFTVDVIRIPASAIPPVSPPSL